MCWAIPAEVIAVRDATAQVRLEGVEREVSLDLIRDVKPGDYVVIHAGYVIQKVSEEDARLTMKIMGPDPGDSGP
jgi:hydrogenase expression/formation protein HypC